MKRLVQVALAAGSVSVLVFAATALSASRESADAPSRATLSATLAHRFTSLVDLKSGGSLVLVGRVVGSAPHPYGRLPFTKTRILVEEIVSGAVQPGAAIDVLETGGLFWPTAKDGTLSPRGVQQVSFEGVPVMATGERYFLFLEPYTGPILENAYVVRGEFQGKFRVNAAAVIDFPGAASELGGSAFLTQRLVIGRRLESIVKEVRALP